MLIMQVAGLFFGGSGVAAFGCTLSMSTYT